MPLKKKENPRKRSHTNTQLVPATKRVPPRKGKKIGKTTPWTTSVTTSQRPDISTSSGSRTDSASSEPPAKRTRRHTSQPSPRSLTESDIPRIVEAVLKTKECSRRRRRDDDLFEDGSKDSHEEEEALEEVSGEYEYFVRVMCW